LLEEGWLPIEEYCFEYGHLPKDCECKIAKKV
jgi:hypothetical protein